MEDKRKRTFNYTSDEKSVLSELVIKYKDIVENKKSDSVTNAEKARGWLRIAEEFNALSSYCRRTPDSLKTCWENMKRHMKKQAASRKRELFKTGGGRHSPRPSVSQSDQMVESILGPSLEGLDNIYDSDALVLNGDEEGVPEDYTEMNSEVELSLAPEIMQDIEIDGSKSSSTLTISLENKKNMTPHHSSNKDTEKQQLQLQEDNDVMCKWDGWTPNSLKRPLSEALKTGGGSQGNKENSWLKRRRPDQKNLADQLIQQKINLVRSLITNAQEESKKRILILEEQLKQEKIKTAKLSQ